jgi:hypothetical protein
MAKTPEGRFKEKLIKDIEKEFPGCIVTKLEADYKNGIPDVLILHKNKWASLECKKDKNEVTKERPNKLAQDHYVSTMDNMSFSRYVYPENKKEVLNELKVHFQ